MLASRVGAVGAANAVCAEHPLGAVPDCRHTLPAGLSTPAQELQGEEGGVSVCGDCLGSTVLLLRRKGVCVPLPSPCDGRNLFNWLPSQSFI